MHLELLHNLAPLNSWYWLIWQPWKFSNICDMYRSQSFHILLWSSRLLFLLPQSLNFPKVTNTTWLFWILNIASSGSPGIFSKRQKMTELNNCHPWFPWQIPVSNCLWAKHLSTTWLFWILNIGSSGSPGIFSKRPKMTTVNCFSSVTYKTT